MDGAWRTRAVLKKGGEELHFLLWGRWIWSRGRPACLLSPGPRGRPGGRWTAWVAPPNPAPGPPSWPSAATLGGECLVTLSFVPLGTAPRSPHPPGFCTISKSARFRFSAVHQRTPLTLQDPLGGPLPLHPLLTTSLHGLGLRLLSHVTRTAAGSSVLLGSWASETGDRSCPELLQAAPRHAGPHASGKAAPPQSFRGAGSTATLLPPPGSCGCRPAWRGRLEWAPPLGKRTISTALAAELLGLLTLGPRLSLRASLPSVEPTPTMTRTCCPPAGPFQKPHPRPLPHHTEYTGLRLPPDQGALILLLSRTQACGRH